MKLFPPDPEIQLYETGFEAVDQFNRAGTSKSLSGLVERIEDPLVIALDGGWGSGKTWFLKRWVGAHKKNGGRATTVYFDAFAHDFMDDPLIALTGVIGERLPKPAESKIWRKVKTAAAKLAKPVVRIGLAVATGGATEIAGPVMDAAAEATSKELDDAAAAFWAREDGKRAAMEQLRTALIDLTDSDAADGKGPVPLVIVVDELDRCRPDYALALLEVIKHFFSVPSVHFVLGVSLEALKHSVRARYGSGIDAERYLRKFVSITIRLPDEANERSPTPLVSVYFHNTAKLMGIHSGAIDIFGKHIALAARVHNFTMRDINQILSRLALVDPEIFASDRPGWGHVLASMILFRLTAPDLERKAVEGTLTLEEIVAFYGIRPEMLHQDGGSYSHEAWLVSALWKHITTNGAGQVENKFYPLFNYISSGYAREIPRIISNDYLSRFTALNLER